MEAEEDEKKAKKAAREAGRRIQMDLDKACSGQWRAEERLE